MSGLIVLWGLLYIGFWISSFFSDDEKHQSESNQIISSKAMKHIRLILMPILLTTYLLLLWHERSVLIPLILSYF